MKLRTVPANAKYKFGYLPQFKLHDFILNLN